MSKKKRTNSTNYPGYTHVRTVAGIEEYSLKKNGLRVLYMHRPDTDIVTTNITYIAGSRDERRGETGAAHMLEHMLFSSTTFDKKRHQKIASPLLFERETGCYINANTWKDRTTYVFTVPTEHLDKAVRIEAERMTGVILTNEFLQPERNNVLSEFDMNNGDPLFALDVQMRGVALQSHPYGHETIGYREDIEDYTTEILERFYRNYYRPDNAIMMIIGDVDRKTALATVKKHFVDIPNPTTPIPRFKIREPKQEGVRRVNVQRPGNTTMLELGFIQPAFPEREWFATYLLNELLVGDSESILQKKFVDTGVLTSAFNMMEPTSEKNMGVLVFNLPPNSDLKKVEESILETIHTVTTADISKLLKKTKIRVNTEELFNRDHSRKIAQELTEYMASGKWEVYGNSEKIINSITAKEIKDLISKLFDITQLTIGTYTNK